MKNCTKNHHFVAQVEQRLNSIDPTIKNKNQRIYSFDILDREAYKINLISENGEKIKESLSFDDLFSFEMLNGNQRINLEQNFKVYENDAGELTEALLKKVKENNNDIKEEILKIFSLKLLNTFRNPNCIEKTLSTIGLISQYAPASGELKNLHEKIDSFHHPQWDDLASTFNVSIDKYKKWMKSLFMILVPRLEQGSNILELMVKEFFEKNESLVNVFICDYSGIPNAHPLLSDRGFTLLKDTEEHTVYDFNLSSTAFISYVFTDINSYACDVMNFQQMQKMISLNKMGSSEVKVHVIRDNLEHLSRYNKNVVYQSRNRVFCKGKVVYGL